MCMRIKIDAKYSIAEEDIPISKLLFSCRKTLITPYVGMRVPENGVLIPKEGFEHIPIKFEETTNFPIIEEGAIHCFAPIYDRFAQYCSSHTYDYHPGVIPKGTEYYISEDGEEYAAMKVILNIPK